jgi:hypothetical protein
MMVLQVSPQHRSTDSSSLYVTPIPISLTSIMRMPYQKDKGTRAHPVDHHDDACCIDDDDAVTLWQHTATQGHTKSNRVTQSQTGGCAIWFVSKAQGGQTG